MTVLLVCYLCGQSEKVRLSMWLLIISVAMYIFTAGGTGVYAYDIGLTPSDDGLYTTTSEFSVEVKQSTTQNNHTMKETASYTHNHAYAQNQVTKQESSSEKLLKKLIIHSENYGSTVVYAGRNLEFYNLVLELLEKKDNTKDAYYLNEVIAVVDNLSNHTAQRYGLDREGLLLGLTTVKYSAQEQQGHTTMHENGDLYTVTRLANGSTKLIAPKYHRISRISFYINGSFHSGCERNQCTNYHLPASIGDTIDAWYMMSSGDGGVERMVVR